MMNQHEGIECDICGRNNFRGCRFKCLICSDFDLCSECFERGLSFGSHASTHPMQSILTRSDMVLFFGGEDVTKAQCLTCPYCGELGLTGKTLLKHMVFRHPSLNEGASPVLCPICATRQNGNNNFITTDLPGHLVVEHRIAGPRSLITRIDEDTAETLRNPQPAPTPQTRRSNSSRSNRNSMDAVFLELMSHLPDVRFDSRGGGGSNAVGSTNVQALQQIQLQLHQHQLDHRLARRAFTRQLPPDFVPTRDRAPMPAADPSNSSRITSSGTRSREATALALEAAIASEARRYNTNGSGRRTAPNRGGSIETIEASGAGDSVENNIKTKYDTERTVKTEENDKLMLKKFLKQDLSDVDHARRDHKRADRSLFVQALLLSAFSTDFKIDEKVDANNRIAPRENHEVTAINSKLQTKENKSKKKKNKKNKLKKKNEGVCVGAVGGQSGSNVLADAQPLDGACIGSSKA